jgi:ribonuclease-3
VNAAAAALAARLGHAFADPALLTQALTHRSAADPRRRMLDSNERLEFLGDRVLALVIAEWLVERFAEEREGQLGKRLSVLVARPTLQRVAEALALGAALHVPPAEGRTGLRARDSVLADATEALIGALYLDGGLAAARRFVRREWEGFLAADPEPPMSAKSRLQELLAARGALAAYRVLSADGPAHAPRFVVEVAAEGRAATGEAGTKQAAEQAAAAAWLADG